MADLLLIRHGQASFGAADYDKLSPLGERQSRLLGEWFASCGITPDVVATGPQRRQIDTAALCIGVCGGPARDVWLRLDGLGEYDHDAVVARYEPRYADGAAMHAEIAARDNPRRAFHAMYVKAIARWTGGAHDADYAESWPAFCARVQGALRQLAALDARTVMAFTSGGPITAIVRALIGLPDARVRHELAAGQRRDHAAALLCRHRRRDAGHLQCPSPCRPRRRVRADHLQVA